MSEVFECPVCGGSDFHTQLSRFYEARMVRVCEGDDCGMSWFPEEDYKWMKKGSE